MDVLICCKTHMNKSHASTHCVIVYMCMGSDVCLTGKGGQCHFYFLVVSLSRMRGCGLNPDLRYNSPALSCVTALECNVMKMHFL